jgi:hypothetical protein
LVWAGDTATCLGGKRHCFLQAIWASGGVYGVLIVVIGGGKGKEKRKFIRKLPLTSVAKLKLFRPEIDDPVH